MSKKEGAGNPESGPEESDLEKAFKEWGPTGVLLHEYCPVVNQGSLPDDEGNTITFKGKGYKDIRSIPAEELKGEKYVMLFGGSGYLYCKVSPEGKVDVPGQYDIEEVNEEARGYLDKIREGIEKQPGTTFLEKLAKYKSSGVK